LTRSVKDLGVLVETYFLAGMWSLMSVSEQIDTRTAARGLLPRQGKMWNPKTVHDLLQAEVA
jgi:hypothetical protein